jgi:hypothetical protein
MFETEMWLSQASKPDEDRKSNQNMCQIDDFETWYKNHKFKTEGNMLRSQKVCSGCGAEIRAYIWGNDDEARAFYAHEWHDRLCDDCETEKEMAKDAISA